MGKKLDGWRALASDERWLLVKLAMLLPVLGSALRLLGVRRTYWLLAGSGVALAGRAQVDDDSVVKAQRLGRLVNIASGYGPYRATCLPRSLALWWLLRRRGLAPQLRIGVGKRAEQFHAHAWVEVGGQAVNDHPAIAENYAAYPDLTDRLPGSFRTS